MFHPPEAVIFIVSYMVQFKKNFAIMDEIGALLAVCVGGEFVMNKLI